MASPRHRSSKNRSRQIHRLDTRKAREPAVEGDDLQRWESDPIGGGGLRQPKTDFRDFMALYAAQPWVFVCVQAIASAIASVRYKILKGGEETKDEKILQVFKTPNPHQTWFEFVEAFVCYLELVGNTFLEEVRDKDQNLVAMFPLRPDRMRILPHPKFKIAGYRYQTSERAPADSEIAFSAEDITHIKYFNPLNEYWGMSPAWASQNGLTLDFWSLAYNKGYFRRGAEPGFVLETDNSMSDPAYNRLMDAWRKRHQGVEKSHTPAVLEEGLKYKPISPSQKDMQFIETRKMTREEILAAWRVPPVVVGLLEFASYASAREQRKIFWTDNIFPKLTRISEVINANLMDPGLEFKFDTESITSLIEDERVAAEIGMQYTTHGVMTINEFRRKYLNLPPVKWGNVWWAPVGLAPVDSGVHPTTPGFSAPAGQQTTDGMQTGLKGPAFVPKLPFGYENAGNQRPSSKSEEGPFEKIERPEPNWDDPKEVWLWNRWTLWKNRTSPDANRIEKQIRSFFKDQLARLHGKITDSSWPKPKKKAEGNGHLLDINKDDRIESWVASLDQDRANLEQLVDRNALDILKKHGKVALGELGLRTDFNLKNPAVIDWVKKYSANQVVSINDTTKEAIRRELGQAVDAGEDFKQMMERLGRQLDGPVSESRARAIARTEVVTLTNQAKLQVAKDTGIVQKKTWISELLPTTRDSHRKIHGHTIGIDDFFPVESRTGIDEMDGPGDITADPENLVNCFLHPSVKILASTGWKKICKIIPGDEVLTHKGRFRKVVRTLNESRPRYSGDAIQIKIEYRTQNGNRKILELPWTTPDHPFLSNGRWASASSIEVNDRLSVSMFPCQVCGVNAHIVDPIATGWFCSRSCERKLSHKKQYPTDKSKDKLRQYATKARAACVSCVKTEPGFGNKMTESAHSMIRELATMGLQSTQRYFANGGKWIDRMSPAGAKKALAALERARRFGLTNKGNTSKLEDAMAGLLEILGIKTKRHAYVCGFQTDMLVPKHRLIIECDGEYWHNYPNGLSIDHKKDAIWRKAGYKVLRFWGAQIVKNAEGCARAIKTVISNHSGEIGTGSVRVASITRKPYRSNQNCSESRLYNISVDGDESYVIYGGIISHNCLCILDWPPETPEFADLFGSAKKQEEKISKTMDRMVKLPIPIKKRTTLIRDPKDGTVVGSDVEFTYKREGIQDGGDDKVSP